MKTNLDCSIVILSYNSKEVTDTCLTKIKKAITFSEEKLHNTVNVIVVDNASKDGSPDMIKAKHPWVKLVASKENVGYPAGNNIAMEKADTPFILLMNSDVYIEEDSLYKAFKSIDGNKDCDVLVGRCIYPNGVLQYYGGFLPTPLRIILWSFGFESVPILKDFLPKIYGFSTEYYHHEGRMQWCPPNFMLIRREVYDQYANNICPDFLQRH